MDPIRATNIRLTTKDRERIDKIVELGYATSIVGAIRWALQIAEHFLENRNGPPPPRSQS